MEDNFIMCNCLQAVHAPTLQGTAAWWQRRAVPAAVVGHFVTHCSLTQNHRLWHKPCCYAGPPKQTLHAAGITSDAGSLCCQIWACLTLLSGAPAVQPAPHRFSSWFRFQMLLVLFPQVAVQPLWWEVQTGRTSHSVGTAALASAMSWVGWPLLHPHASGTCHVRALSELEDEGSQNVQKLMRYACCGVICDEWAHVHICRLITA